MDAMDVERREASVSCRTAQSSGNRETAWLPRPYICDAARSASAKSIARPPSGRAGPSTGSVFSMRDRTARRGMLRRPSARPRVDLRRASGRPPGSLPSRAGVRGAACPRGSTIPCPPQTGRRHRPAASAVGEPRRSPRSGSAGPGPMRRALRGDEHERPLSGDAAGVVRPRPGTWSCGWRRRGFDASGEGRWQPGPSLLPWLNGRRDTRRPSMHRCEVFSRRRAASLGGSASGDRRPEELVEAGPHRALMARGSEEARFGAQLEPAAGNPMASVLPPGPVSRG